MTLSVAVLGAGGKMGFRVAKKLVEASYDVRAVEVADAGKKRLADAGIVATDTDTGVKSAKVVVLALPDNIIGQVAHDLVPKLSAGTMLLILDAAAPYADALPMNRPDLTYFVGHPCHPPLFNDETDLAARRADFETALPEMVHGHSKDVLSATDGWSFTAIGGGSIDYAPIWRRLATRAPDIPIGLELPLRLRRPGRAEPTRRPNPLPLETLRDALRRSLAFLREIDVAPALARSS